MKGLTMGGVALLIAAPQILLAQAQGPPGGVQLVEHDDGMVSWVYAFVRTEQGPILDIDARGVSFGRDPNLVFACLDGNVAVVYKFDTSMLGEDDAVRVQFRFAEKPSSERQAWPLNHDPRTKAEMEVGLAALGADSANPLLQMIAGTSDAATMPSEHTADFLEAARAASQVALRVTDPLDGETHMDVFSLLGFGEAIDQVIQRCPQ